MVLRNIMCNCHYVVLTIMCLHMANIAGTRSIDLMDFRAESVEQVTNNSMAVLKHGKTPFSLLMVAAIYCKDD